MVITIILQISHVVFMLFACAVAGAFGSQIEKGDEKTATNLIFFWVIVFCLGLLLGFAA